jgi:hypothetical protein
MFLASPRCRNKLLTLLAQGPVVRPCGKGAAEEVPIGSAERDRIAANSPTTMHSARHDSNAARPVQNARSAPGAAKRPEGSSLGGRALTTAKGRSG